MLKADFHVHTKLSEHGFLHKLGLLDGLNTPDEMARVASKKGLDVIAITDHNVLFDYKKAKKLSKKYNILVLPGVEFSLKGKEAISIGIHRLPKVSTLEELRDVTKEQDGLLVAPHPYDPLNRGFREFDKFDAIEVLNGFGGFGYKRLIKKADELKKGKTCGSDSHCTCQIGSVHFMIDAEKNEDDIIRAVKKRKTTPLGNKISKLIQGKYYFKKYLLLECLINK